MSLDAPSTARRRCVVCSLSFTPVRSTQLYCQERCRKRAARMRSPGNARSRRVIDIVDQLDSAAEKVRLMHGREPVRSQFLYLYARVAEAERHLQIWTERLQQRRADLKAAEDPNFLIRRIVVNPGEPIALPPDADAYGGCSTDGTLAIVCVGIHQRPLSRPA